MLRPLHKNVILRLEHKEAAAEGQIILTSPCQPSCLGVVVAVGPDVEDQDYGPGNRVLFHPHDPVHYSEAGTDYLILRDADILAVQEQDHVL